MKNLRLIHNIRRILSEYLLALAFEALPKKEASDVQMKAWLFLIDVTLREAHKENARLNGLYR